MNWNHLYTFYEVGRFQSLKQAAELLKVASSTASEQIQKLEKTLGKKLFRRSSKGLFLTKDGTRLLDHTREIFEAGGRLLDHFSNADIGGYSVRVGIEETISNDLATEITSQYWDLYTPFGTVNTSREAEHSVLVENILQGNIDWGISIRRPRRKDLSFNKIGGVLIVFCCSKELYQQFLDPKDILRNIPLAQSTKDSGLNQRIENYLREHQITPKEYIYSDHQDFVKKLCRRGRCIIYTAENPVEEETDLQKFQIAAPLSVDLFAIWREKDENMLSIKKLKELLTPKIQEFPPHYDDPQWQIQVSNVEEKLLRKKEKKLKTKK